MCCIFYRLNYFSHFFCHFLTFFLHFSFHFANYLHFILTLLIPTHFPPPPYTDTLLRSIERQASISSLCTISRNHYFIPPHILTTSIDSRVCTFISRLETAISRSVSILQCLPDCVSFCNTLFQEDSDSRYRCTCSKTIPFLQSMQSMQSVQSVQSRADDDGAGAGENNNTQDTIIHHPTSMIFSIQNNPKYRQFYPYISYCSACKNKILLPMESTQTLSFQVEKDRIKFLFDTNTSSFSVVSPVTILTDEPEVRVCVCVFMCL